MRRYFITGTDTDCGKTYVTCQLVDFLKANNHEVIALKPVASGCIEEKGELLSEDVLRLERHLSRESLTISKWRFKPPISPHLAARAVGQSVSAKDIIDFCESPMFDAYDDQLIEGAGGLMAPLNDDETWLDFLIQSQYPVILVVGMRLGCLNHALLTSFAFTNQQINCVGWVANCLDKDMLALEENINTLVEKFDFPLIATIPFNDVILPEPCCLKTFC